MIQALFETLTYFIKWRLLSPKFWIMVVASWAYVYSILQHFDAARLAITGTAVFGSVAAHVLDQHLERMANGGDK